MLGVLIDNGGVLKVAQVKHSHRTISTYRTSNNHYENLAMQFIWIFSAVNTENFNRINVTFVILVFLFTINVQYTTQTTDVFQMVILD